MVNIPLYKTYADYPNATGVYKILYPLRDSVVIMNPFFVILFGFFLVATVGTYYVYTSFAGRARFFVSTLSASFATFVISIFFSLGNLVSPISVLIFIAITIISLALTIFYK